MPDVSIFRLENQDVNVKDVTARSAAQAARTAAVQAQAQVQEILDLSRLEISYESGTKTITFTTYDHEPTPKGGYHNG